MGMFGVERLGVVAVTRACGRYACCEVVIH
jgi:hypothetical protein